MYGGKGELSARSIEMFVSKTFSPFITSVKSTEDFKKSLSSKPELPMAIFCTKLKSSSIPMILKSFAYRFHKHISFIHVNSEAEPELLAHMTVDPANKLTIRLIDGSLKVFNGNMEDKDSVDGFLEAHVPVSEETTSADVSSEHNEENSRINSSAQLKSLVDENSDTMVLVIISQENAEKEIEEEILSRIRNKVPEGLLSLVEFRCLGGHIDSQDGLSYELCAAASTGMTTYEWKVFISSLRLC